MPSTIRADHVSALAPSTDSFPGFNFALFGAPSGLFLNNSPADSALSRFPSALPTPLYGRQQTRSTMADQGPGSLPASPISATLDDGSHILTHFDVVHHHIDQNASQLGMAIDTARDTLNSALMQKLDDNAKEAETQFSELREHVGDLREDVGDLRKDLNAAEHNVGRMSGEMETINKSIADLSTFIKGPLASSIQDVTKTNQNLSKQVHGLEKRLNENNQKLDALQQQVTSSSSSVQTTGQASASAQGMNVGVPTPHYMPHGFQYHAPTHPVYVQTSSTLPQLPPHAQYPRHLQANDVRSQGHPRRGGGQGGIRQGGEHQQAPDTGHGAQQQHGAGGVGGRQHGHSPARVQMPQQQVAQHQMQQAQAGAAPNLAQHPAYARNGSGTGGYFEEQGAQYGGSS